MLKFQTSYANLNKVWKRKLFRNCWFLDANTVLPMHMSNKWCKTNCHSRRYKFLLGHYLFFRNDHWCIFLPILIITLTRHMPVKKMINNIFVLNLFSHCILLKICMFSFVTLNCRFNIFSKKKFYRKTIKSGKYQMIFSQQNPRDFMYCPCTCVCVMGQSSSSGLSSLQWCVWTTYRIGYF